MDGRVDRLQRRMREKGQFIYGFDPLPGSREGAFDVPTKSSPGMGLPDDEASACALCIVSDETAALGP